MVVLVDEVHQILAPDRAVQRADELDLIQDARRLFEQQLDMRAVFAHDVGQIATRIVDPVAVEVDFIRKQLAVQRAERAERIRGEQRAVCGVKGDHRLGPVHHRRGNEGHDVLAEALGIAFPDLDQLVAVDSKAELAHEHERLFGRDHFDRRVADQDLLDRRAVVGLHMVDDQIVQRAAVQQVLDVLQQLAAGRPVYGVKQHGLLIEQQVSVVGYTARDGMDIFKQGKAMIVRTDPIQIVRYIAYAVHTVSSFLFGQASMNMSLPSPHSGQTQSSGSFSNSVPGAISASSSPSSGTYSYPQPPQT